MGNKSKIQWVAGDDGTPGATWNPIRARNKITGKIGWHCVKVSQGCRECYAEKMNIWRGNGVPFAADKTGQGELLLDEKILEQPLRWKRGRRIFVCSMSDLFGEFVPENFIDEIFEMMAHSPQHTFIVLTKRARRMKEYLTRGQEDWPLRNVWLGISCEDQASADNRIPLLLQTPAAVRFLSYEPALNCVDFGLFGTVPKDWGIGYRAVYELLHQVIIGGESGPSARPFDIEWARVTAAQCRAAGVACFVKQLGSCPVMSTEEWKRTKPLPALKKENHEKAESLGSYVPLKLHDSKGGDMSEWPIGLRVRQYPKGG
jgi:protein gp37